MASEFRYHTKETLSEAILKKKDNPPQIHSAFLQRFALKPLMILSLLLCTGVAFAAYWEYFPPFGEITTPAECSPTPQVFPRSLDTYGLLLMSRIPAAAGRSVRYIQSTMLLRQTNIPLKLHAKN